VRDRDQQRHAHFAAAQTRDSESSLQPRSRLGIEFLLELSSGARDDRPSLAARQLAQARLRHCLLQQSDGRA
jgi:hypothetical protein